MLAFWLSLNRMQNWWAKKLLSQHNEHHIGKNKATVVWKTTMNRKGTMPLSQFLGIDFPRAGRKNICKVRSCPRAQQSGFFRVDETQKHGLGRLQNQGSKAQATALRGGREDKRQPQKSSRWDQQKRTSVVDLSGWKLTAVEGSIFSKLPQCR